MARDKYEEAYHLLIDMKAKRDALKAELDQLRVLLGEAYDAVARALGPMATTCRLYPDTWDDDDFLDGYVGHCEGCGRLASHSCEDADLCDGCWAEADNGE